MNRADGLRARTSAATRDERVVKAVRLATWRKVDARQESLDALPHAAELRDRAAQIRQSALENLAQYLGQFVENATRRGARVHFARDAAAATQIVCDIARQRGLKLAVKGKSMTSEEIHLNDALEARGVRPVETDLGEFIVQLDHDRPSHIITPIIHKDRRQVAEAMAREIGCPLTDDPTEMTKTARAYLREIFRRCDLGITGVNFAIAETGTICLITNEGNGRMTVTRPRVHVALMGIEKVIPRMADLPVLLKLIARSSTGQPMGVYTTLVTGPKRPHDPDGPEELHVVIVDNGRSNVLTGPHPEVLRCIRCGACLNACPVYRNIGGHAYASVYPGPIGSLITPLLYGDDHHELPRASSLCGACELSCPVKIPIPELLVKLRARYRARQSGSKRLAMRMWAWAMSVPAMYRLGQALLRTFVPTRDGRWATRGPGPLGEWTKVRDLKCPPARSFRQRWEEELRDGG